MCNEEYGTKAFRLSDSYFNMESGCRQMENFESIHKKQGRNDGLFVDWCYAMVTNRWNLPVETTPAATQVVNAIQAHCGEGIYLRVLLSIQNSKFSVLFHNTIIKAINMFSNML